MVDMARFVKPILVHGAAGPAVLRPPRASRQLLGLRPPLPAPARARDQHNLLQLMTMSAADLLDQWFETDVLKATMSASGIIGTFLGVRSPGTAYVLLHHYMGEIDGAFRSWGFSRGGTGAISRRHRRRGARRPASRSAPRPRIERDQGEGRPRDGRRRSKSGDEIDAKVVVSSVDPHRDVPEAARAEALLDAEFLDRGAAATSCAARRAR